MFKLLVIGSLAFIAYGVYALAGDAPQREVRAQANVQKVSVSDLSCISHRTGTDLKGTIKNTSSEPLAFVKVYGTFDGKVFDGFINENPLQPGNYSNFLLPGPGHHAGRCALLYVQDRDGNRIN